MRGHAQPPILKTNTSQDTTKTARISLAYDILASAGAAITYNLSRNIDDHCPVQIQSLIAI
jgi:hypothetical protein